jgi:hypothetical protein
MTMETLLWLSIAALIIALYLDYRKTYKPRGIF